MRRPSLGRGGSRGAPRHRRPRGALRSVLLVAALAVAVALGATPASAKAPTTAGVDAYSRPSTAPCSSTPKPGTVAIAQILTQAYGIRADVQTRVCSTNQYVSDHSRGLAIDWSVPAGSPAGRQLLDWLFAGDKQGDHQVRLRRLGISYIIWDDHIWTATSDQARTSPDVTTWRTYDPGPCAAKYGAGTDCGHLKHMHISLGDAGGAMTTSWWQPTWHGVRDTPTGALAPPRAPSVFEAAFAADTFSPWSVGTVDQHGDWQQAVMPGTSPAIAALSGGGYEIAYQASNGHPATVGTAGIETWPVAMMPGTSPAITALAGGGYEVAFQAATSELVTVGDGGTTSWGLGMMPGTDPAIAAVGSGYEVAFQANTGHLWTVGAGAESLGDRQRPMMPGTSPAITPLADGTYEVAYQADTTDLMTIGASGTRDWGLGMMPGTNPATAAVGTGFEVAFQANTGNLWTVGSAAGARGDRQQAMAPGTSPAIAALGANGYQVAFQAPTSWLATMSGAGGTVDWGLGMASGTSPAIASS